MSERKIYYSFHDIPQSKGGGYTQYSDYTGMKFSRMEIIHLFIAMIVLTLAFSFALAPTPPLSNLSVVAANIPIAFLAILTAFICHELAHKYMGQKLGYWSEFRMFPMGLLLALGLSVIAGIVFAAPGAVQIFGQPTREESGKMAAVGPLINIFISLLFIIIFIASTGYLRSIAFFIAYINVFLGFFNLLPFGPLDGSKIFRWKKEIWIGLFAVSIVIFVFLLV
jgi:Zn-dependent protease